MQVIYERCAGIDVHKKSIVVCVILTDQAGQADKRTRTFSTMTADLSACADWLQANGVTHVAMESTGVYWQPVFNLLEGRFQLLVVNPEHIKKLRGDKTDVKDAEWIADLLRHGLLKGSYVPSRTQRQWRELTRCRSALVDERSRVVNRIQKVLEDANIKLSSVATDILGLSGRAMLAAIIQGTGDANALAALAQGKLQAKREQLQQALSGTVQPHHRFMLAQHLSHVDFLDEAIGQLDAEITRQMQPFQAEIARLDTIPGINQRIAQVLLAEVGTDMKPFADAAQLASWAGMCPGNNESAGKRHSGRTRKGSKWLRRALVEAAQAAARTKNTYLSSRYHRLAGRRGRQRAIVAVGHALLEIAFYLITRQQTYTDLGANYYDERDREAVKRRSVHRLEQLGFQVNLVPIVATA